MAQQLPPLFLFLLSFRLLNALSLRTFFQPDEFFQSLEPAWNIAFGRDGWITWEWHHNLRSIAHPLLFAGVYKLASSCASLLSLTDETTINLLQAAPKVTQAVFAAVGDHYSVKLAERIGGAKAKRYGLWLTIGSAWQWFCSPRTFANCLESSITAAALAFWPWDNRQVLKNEKQKVQGAEKEAGFRVALLLAAVACILRPTNVLIWGALGSFLFMQNDWQGRRNLVFEALWIGSTILLLNALLDRAYYGSWTFPPLNFLIFNLVQSLSTFYGRMPWHYYLSQGLPLLTTSFLPLTLYALYHNLCMPSFLNPGFQLAATVVAVIAVYSFIPHKEVRFIYPLLPILHVLSATTLTTLFQRRNIILAMILLNIPIAWYGGHVHQRGVIDVIDHLGQTQRFWNSVGFLMPCHSTPWLHLPGNGTGKDVWALTCEPPIGIDEKERASYVDEADVFYNDPVAFMVNNLVTGHPEHGQRRWPSRLIFFEQLESTMRNHTQETHMKYRECWRGFNSHFHDDWRRKGDVVVWCSDESGDDMERNI